MKGGPVSPGVVLFEVLKEVDRSIGVCVNATQVNSGGQVVGTRLRCSGACFLFFCLGLFVLFAVVFRRVSLRLHFRISVYVLVGWHIFLPCHLPSLPI